MFVLLVIIKEVVMTDLFVISGLVICGRIRTGFSRFEVSVYDSNRLSSYKCMFNAQPISCTRYNWGEMIPFTFHLANMEVKMILFYD